ncbi:MAG TPA: AI-2E family transporter [Candidatus Limnocylindrales bacterium]|nr:AI-2E family transporter [Candidatus Limnocylindrales bacterium]
MTTGLTPRERQWLDALLVLATIVAFFAAVAVVGQVLRDFFDIILIFFLAWLLAFMIRPIADFLGRFVGAVPKAVTVIGAYVAIVIILGALLGVVAGALVGSIGDFLANLEKIQANLAAILTPIQGWLVSLGLTIDLVAIGKDLLVRIASGAVDILGPLRELAVASLGALGSLLIIFFLSIFIAVDSEDIQAFLFRLVPARYATEAELLRTSVGQSFGGFIRGQAIQGFVYAGIALLASVLLGLPFPALTAAAAGILQAIPFFGPFVSWAPPVFVAMIFVPDAILPAAIIMGVGWFVVMNVLQPRLMSDALHIHPIVVLGSVLIGAEMAGVAGAIFGIPVAAIASAFFFHYLREHSDGSVAARAARRLEEREGRPVRVPREPAVGEVGDIEEDEAPA